MITISILAGAFLVGSTLAYRAVHAWRAPMPAPRASLTYHPVTVQREVPHVDVDAVPNYSYKRAIAAAEAGAPAMLTSKREQAQIERAAVLALIVPFNAALDNALRRFNIATAPAMKTAARWIAEAAPRDEITYALAGAR